MVEVTASRLGRRDRYFTLSLFSAGAFLLAFISAMENDRRGLLRWDRPGVFASGNVKLLPDSYDIVYLGSGQRRGPSDLDDRKAARLIPRRGGTSGIVTRAGTGPQSTSFAPLVQASPSPSTGSTGTLLAANANPPTRVAITPFTPGNLGGGGGSVPGLIVVETPPPPVPAVPEPAAWLLMIFGVGFLAAALRRRAVAENGDDGGYLVTLADQVI